MALEIEKKFLVTSDDFKRSAFKKTRIKQGYISSNPERTVRIRIKENEGYITIKGIGNHAGTTRYEWEKEIPLSEAEELLKLCEPGIIDKTRYEVRSGSHIFEIDEFYGSNLGLVVAEVELMHDYDHFKKPAWLGAEVTGDTKYYNAMLMKKPYSRW